LFDGFTALNANWCLNQALSPRVWLRYIHFGTVWQFSLTLRVSLCLGLVGGKAGTEVSSEGQLRRALDTSRDSRSTHLHATRARGNRIGLCESCFFTLTKAHTSLVLSRESSLCQQPLAAGRATFHILGCYRASSEAEGPTRRYSFVTPSRICVVGC
jgi:hypothetical protein